LVVPISALRRSNILRGTAPLAEDEALRLAPLPFDVAVIPDFPVATFNKVQAIRIWMNGDLDGALPQNAATVPSDESKESGLNLKKLSASAIIDRQMEQQVAMNDVGVGFALTAPHTRQPASNPRRRSHLCSPSRTFAKSLP
jgi:hypothetical protein